MPSSHAQFTAFFAAYLSLFLLARHAPVRGRTPTPWPRAVRGALALAACAGAALVAASRVVLGYHTVAQTAAGCGAGVVAAGAWFGITAWARRAGWVRWAVGWPVARALRVRDLLPEEDLADAGWARWQALTRGKQE
jgi:dolichyldiphosphatase